MRMGPGIWQSTSRLGPKLTPSRPFRRPFCNSSPLAAGTVMAAAVTVAEDWQPPVFEKGEAEKAALVDAVSKNILFSELGETSRGGPGEGIVWLLGSLWFFVFRCL